MKMLPVQLSLNPPLGLWSDVLWRCPPAPPSQLAELKTQLPPSLPTDPRLWGREDVTIFLRFCEREFDLPKVDHDLFQMNGKALCLLTRADFGSRCPGAGDVLHNVLQMLIIESHMMQWHLPNSPVTPTSRYPISPHSHPPTPTWPPIAPPESPFHGAAHMHHFMAPNSVTLSPPPSVDSQASSPPQDSNQASGSASSGNTACSSNNCGNGSASGSNSNCSSSVSMAANGSGSSPFATNQAAACSSNQSDSDDETYTEAASAARNNAAASAQYANSSPPTTPILKDMPQNLTQQITNSFVSSWSQTQTHNQKLQQSNNGVSGCGNGGSVSAPTTPSYMQAVKREFFPENTEPNTNGRLLWDFLQQLLNDRKQKYSDLIAWKCRDTGVFKIVDPAGLAKLWGIQKNHLSMNYDKMSRALRYYYRVNILRKVQGERHCYQFLRNPTELKNIKNISLLRQTVTNNSNNNNTTSAAAGANGCNSAAGCNGLSAAGNGQQQVNSGNNQTASNANMNSTNWPLPHQMAAAAVAAAAASRQQQSPQPTPSRGNNMSLPTITSSAAAAAVAAAAAAAYGPPPTSPLFMHAINGAFHYLSSNAGPPPNSPSLPPTPSEKLQFSALKLESAEAGAADEMKPTDLSVAGSSSSEKRPYSSPSANDDCYPLIRNADGLTTIKLIRYNEESKTSEDAIPQTAKEEQQHESATPMDSSDGNGCDVAHQQQQQQQQQQLGNNNNNNNMPTDLRK